MARSAHGESESETRRTRIDPKLIEQGWFQKHIADFAYETALRKQSGDKPVIGVNRFVEEEAQHDIEIHPYDPTTADRQVSRTQRVRRERVGVDLPPASLECSCGIGHAPALAVDPQPHRRMRVVRLEDRFHPLAVLSSQRRDQPARVRRTHGEIGVHRGQHRVALALETSQDRVHESRRASEAELARRIDGLGDRGVRRRLAGQQLIEADLEQGSKPRRELLGRTIGKPAQDLDQSEMPAQGSVGERSLEPARRSLVGVPGEQLVERAAVGGHPGHELGCRGADLRRTGS
jgi:hypothetical protein